MENEDDQYDKLMERFLDSLCIEERDEYECMDEDRQWVVKLAVRFSNEHFE